MNIIAKPNWDTTRTVRILSFVPMYPHDIYAVYVDEQGRIDTCLSDQLTIIDPEYEIPRPTIEALKNWDLGQLAVLEDWLDGLKEKEK